MTLKQFIEKHSLSPVQMSGWKPAMFLMDDKGDVKRFEDKYEFYANADKTVWVSVNRTRNRFRLCYHDLLVVYSDWEMADMNYELQPIATGSQPGM